MLRILTTIILSMTPFFEALASNGSVPPYIEAIAKEMINARVARPYGADYKFIGFSGPSQLGAYTFCGTVDVKDRHGKSTGQKMFYGVFQGFDRPIDFKFVDKNLAPLYLKLCNGG